MNKNAEHTAASADGTVPSGAQLFFRRSMLWLSISGIFGLAVVWSFAFSSSRELAKASTPLSVELRSDAPAASQPIYRFELVKTTRTRGIIVTQDDPQQEQMILLPARLGIFLGAVGILGLVSADLRQRNVVLGKFSLRRTRAAFRHSPARRPPTT